MLVGTSRFRDNSNSKLRSPLFSFSCLHRQVRWLSFLFELEGGRNVVLVLLSPSLRFLDLILWTSLIRGMSQIIFDDADTRTISYSSTWVGYEGQEGNIDARAWLGQSFHACRAEPLNGSQPCWANITFTGSSIALYSEHSNLQQRYWCGIVGETEYKWYNGSTLEGEAEGTPFVWGLNHTRCKVEGLENTQHTLAFGQLADDTQGIGITLDYYEVGNSSTSSKTPTWTPDFTTVAAPANIGWASGTASGVTSTRASTTSSAASSTSSGVSTTSSSSPVDPSATAPSDSSNSENSSSNDSGGGGSTATTGIGLGVGLGGAALLALAGFLLWRHKKQSNKARGLGRTGSIAPTETTYGGFQSVSGGSPVSRTARGRFGSTSQSYLPSYVERNGAPSEMGGRGTGGGGGVPEVQTTNDEMSSPTTYVGSPGSRFLENPASFRER